MLITLLKENLKEGLRNVQRAIVKSTAYPILECILLTAQKNFLCLTSTNLEIGIKKWILAKIEKEGEVVLPFSHFFQLIENTQEDVIKLVLEDTIFKIEGKNFWAKIPILKKEEFPILPQISGQEEIVEIRGDILANCLSKIVNIPSLSLARPEISGILLNFDKEKFKMVATDSFRLAEITQVLSFNLKKEYSLILPQKTVKEVINLFQNEEKVFVYLSENQIFFQSFYNDLNHPKAFLVSRLIEGEYPDYKEIIPKSFKTSVFLNKKIFFHTLKSASAFCGKNNEVTLMIKPKENILEIFTSDQKLGEFQSKLEGKIEGKELKISFNLKFLLDGVLEIETENLIFELIDNESPVIIRPEEKTDYFYILMPIKTL